MTAINPRTREHHWNFQVINGLGVDHSVREKLPADDHAAVSNLFLNSSVEPPKLPDAFVPLTRQLDLLTKGVLGRAMTLISAPAGAGKTVLAAAWCAQRPVAWPVAWLSVEENGGQPLMFWSHLMHAIEHIAVPLGRAGRKASLRGFDIAFLTRLAADLLDLPEPLVLVVDGFDRIGDLGVLDGVDFLLRRAYPKFRLVLCGRGEPRLPLQRYRLADMMADIGPDTLAFTAAESEELFANHALTMSSSVATDLVQRTAGWAAGLRLAAMTLQPSSGAAGSGTTARTEVSAERLNAAFAECSEYACEYLLGEVLEPLPPELREFVLRASVSDQFWPELVNELTGRRDGDRILRDLARSGFIVRLRCPTMSYSVHPMLGEMLRKELQYEAPEEVARLHGVCARWHTRQGHRLPAVRHAVEAGDWQQAAEIVIEDLQIAALVDPLSLSSRDFVDSVKAIPGDVGGPSAAVVRAAVALARHEFGDAVDGLELARKQMEPQLAPVELALSAAIVELGLCTDTGAYLDGLQAAERANNLLSQLSADQRSAHPELAVLLGVHRGVALLWTGAERAAMTALEAGLKALGWPRESAAATAHLQLRCLNLLALGYATQGCLRRAKALGHGGHRIAERLGPAARERAIGARIALAWAYVEQGETATARQWAASAQTSLDRNADTVLAPLLAVVQARLLERRGGRTEAVRQLDELLAGDSALPDWVRQRVGLERADIQLALTNPDGAERILDSLPDHDSPAAAVLRARAAALHDGRTAADAELRLEPDVGPKVRVDALLAHACSEHAAGRVPSALRSVERALQVAEPEQLRRPFTEAPPQLRTLIRSVLSLDARIPGRLSPKRMPAEAAIHGPDSNALAPNSADPIEELTDRESEVLRYLAEMLSTQEVAAAMFVSVNTVRTHIRSILRKLNAPRRNVAVRRARELQLV